MEVNTKYHEGDVININNIDWVVNEVVMKYGRSWGYGLEHNNNNGDRIHINVDTGSLETIIKAGENK